MEGVAQREAEAAIKSGESAEEVQLDQKVAG